MDKQTFTNRIKRLTEERDQLIANVNAYNGAIQEATYWFALLEKEESEKAPSSLLKD